jgi:hypothetical protein
MVLIRFFNPTPDDYNISYIHAEYKGAKCVSGESNITVGDEVVAYLSCDKELGDPEDFVKMNLTMGYGFSSSDQVYKSHGDLHTIIEGGTYSP